MPGLIRHFPALLPDLLVEDAGSIYGASLDMTRICHTHQWASLPVPVIAGQQEPVCEICEVERLAVDGRARYRDLVSKREAGVI